jgi:hypothetical protein
VEEGRRLFAAALGDRDLAELVIVIAALDEADSLPEVLAEIPSTVGGVPATVLVVDDGSEDATADIARAHGAVVLRLGRNCGHGVALRAGYRAAWEHGARIVATLDADGQWDPADLPGMVVMVTSGRADMVIGSRTLGSTLDHNAFRTLGVPVFASLARALTGASVTDTSSGLRVMTTDLLRNVPQTQPQYQTSELVVGVALAGYRIAEVPTVMRPRLHGTSKKGMNLAYAFRYARVMLGTWWREAHRLDTDTVRRRVRSGRRTLPTRSGGAAAIEAAVSAGARGLLRIAGGDGPAGQPAAPHLATVAPPAGVAGGPQPVPCIEGPAAGGGPRPVAVGESSGVALGVQVGLRRAATGT